MTRECQSLPSTNYQSAVVFQLFKFAAQGGHFCTYDSRFALDNVRVFVFCDVSVVPTSESLTLCPKSWVEMRWPRARRLLVVNDYTSRVKNRSAKRSVLKEKRLIQGRFVFDSYQCSRCQRPVPRLILPRIEEMNRTKNTYKRKEKIEREGGGEWWASN